MVFIPMVAHRAAPPSPRALDLARRLKEEVDKFERQYPGTSREDLRRAAAIAVGEEPISVPIRRRVAAAVLGAVAAMGGLAFMLNATPGNDAGAAAAVAVAMGSVAVIMVAVLRSRRQG